MAKELLTREMLYPYGEYGGRLYVHPSLNMQKIISFFRVSHQFAADECHFQHEQTNEPAKGYHHLTTDQKAVLTLLKENPFVYAGKGRQSYMSEVGIRWLLRETMYLEGCKSVLVADKNDTAEELFSRLNYMYKHMSADVKVPLANGRAEGNDGDIEFIHGGKIKVVSGETRVPAIGFSPSRAHISELGKMRDQMNFVKNMLPSIMKKQGARVFIETTPGEYGDLCHSYWVGANRGNNVLVPYFIKWFNQPGCSRPVSNESPDVTAAELEYMQRYGMTRENIEYMRIMLPLFNYDMLAFRNMYPFHEMDGWTAAESATMPGDIFQPHIRGSFKDTDVAVGKSQLHEVRQPNANRRYVIVADPAGISQRPDATAITVFDDTGEEVAFWAGSITPSEAADKVCAAAAVYRGQDDALGPKVAIESNKSDVISILNDRTRLGQVKLKQGQERLFRWFKDKEGKQHWWASAVSKKRAEGRLVAAAKTKAIRLRSYHGLMEILSYDRTKWKDRRTHDDSGQHHYDRAISYLIAADVLTQMRWVTLPETEDEVTESPAEEPVTIDEAGNHLFSALAFDSLFASTKAKHRDTYQMPTTTPALVRPRR